MDKQTLEKLLAPHGQDHVLRFWENLSPPDQVILAAQISGIDFALMDRLIEAWVLATPPPESFQDIRPVPTIPRVDSARADCIEALAAGEAALRAGRVGLLLVAGGQGTRLGFDGPKGAYPVGPLSGATLFEAHADKIHNIQNKYGCTLPWYIMVSDTNEAETRAFFAQRGHFGLESGNIHFFTQHMVPCVDNAGKLMLEAPGRLAMNPNGHGGTYLAMRDHGMLEDCRERGVDTLSYFQVDNWAVKVADPYFIGYHLLGHGKMSSKIHRKTEPREQVGVHCLCDGEYRTIEYTEIDEIYPQLLEVDSEGRPVYYAGNTAIHVLDVGFMESICDKFDHFPWHRAHKKIPCIDETGNLIQPDAPNGYKFETFIFDALRFTGHPPIALEVRGAGEYTPIKQYDGENSVQEARQTMREYWAEWLEAAGYQVPRDSKEAVSIEIEINPRFALTQEEFVARMRGVTLTPKGDLAFTPEGVNR